MEEISASVCGTVYHTGDDAVVSQENNKFVAKILKFYLLTVNQEFIPMVTGDSYRAAVDAPGNMMRHPLSDTPIIEPFETCSCFQVKDLNRKVMLYPFQPGKFALVDPMRARVPIPQVLVPVFPKWVIWCWYMEVTMNCGERKYEVLTTCIKLSGVTFLLSIITGEKISYGKGNP